MSVKTDTIFKMIFTMFLLVLLIIFVTIGNYTKDHELKHLMIDWEITCLLGLMGLWVIGGGV